MGAFKPLLANLRLLRATKTGGCSAQKYPNCESKVWALLYTEGIQESIISSWHGCLVANSNAIQRNHCILYKSLYRPPFNILYVFFNFCKDGILYTIIPSMKYLFLNQSTEITEWYIILSKCVSSSILRR